MSRTVRSNGITRMTEEESNSDGHPREGRSSFVSFISVELFSSNRVISVLDASVCVGAWQALS